MPCELHGMPEGRVTTGCVGIPKIYNKVSDSKAVGKETRYDAILGIDPAGGQTALG